MFNFAKYRRGWGDTDRYWGPFTYAPKSTYGWLFGLMLVSGSSDSDYGNPGAYLRIYWFGRVLILGLPQWCCRPEERWVELKAQIYKEGSPNGYWDRRRREYGFQFTNDGYAQNWSPVHFTINYGVQAMDSSVDKDWSCFLPWTDHRMIRHSLYDALGNHFADVPQRTRNKQLSKDESLKRWQEHYEADKALTESCPTRKFRFADFDGEVLVATTRIEEREWRKGTGRFKWVSWFYPPLVIRRLNIDFSGETGERKGSWKGGTISTSGPILRCGILHETAFKAYCAENKMTFLGSA